MKYLPICGIAPLTKKPEGSGLKIASLGFARFFFSPHQFFVRALGNLKVIQTTYEDFDVASCHLGHTHKFGSRVKFL